MALDEALLAQKYELVKLSVLTSSQIAARTAAVTAKLGTTPAGGRAAIIISLTAKSKAANKLISIVEIAKRELVGGGVSLYQYNALASELVEIPWMQEKSADAVHGTGEAERGGESDDAFESMGVQGDGSTKKRLMPVMTTYLSTSAIKELRNAYGEQRAP